MLKLDWEIMLEEKENNAKKLGEEQSYQLIYVVIKNNASKEDLEKVSTDETYRKEMYKKWF